jgi:methyl-accepting chemotaxis protein
MKRIARLKVSTRFAVMGAFAVAMAAMPAALFVSNSYSEMRTAQQEARSSDTLKSMLKVIQLTQQHRGLSALVLGGNAGLQAQRAAKQQEADAAYLKLSAAVAAEQLAPATRAAWMEAARDWAALAAKVAGGQASVPESFTLHTAQVARLLAVTDLMSDDYGLSLDDHLGRSQLIQAVIQALPALTEELGRGRAKGAGMLATKTANSADRQALALFIGQGEARLSEMTLAFGKAAAASADVKVALDGLMQDAAAQAQGAFKLAKEQILQQEQLSYAGPDYVAAFTKTIDAQFKVAEAAMVVLSNQLDAHATETSRWLYGMLAAMLALAGSGAWFSVAAARSITRQLGGEPDEVVALANAVAQGDLRARIAVKDADRDSIVAAMARMQSALVQIVAVVRESSDSIATGSRQIATGNADLSQRTEEQASNLEQTAASMEELAGTVRNNADTARQATQLADSASAVATKGGQVVAQVVATMSEITDSSKRIADIIGVIDGIAFQTNILALNAAVEAARAGEQGRGFAVVASEVRSLAQRSAQAAKEIKTLINASVERVETGSRLVGDAGTTMGDIVDQVQRVAHLIGDIGTATGEQTNGIGQVSDAVAQLDRVTQQNAALVEEAAAAADNLSEQAKRLVDTVSVFRMGEDRGGAGPADASDRSAGQSGRGEAVDAPRPWAAAA